MAATQAIAISRALGAVMQQDRGRLLAALVARLRDYQLAEDALQEAALSALVHWARTGLPNCPQGWLYKVAQRKAIDRIRAAKRSLRGQAEMAVLAEQEAATSQTAVIPDERLRLIFACCHPALEPKTQQALTLYSLAGLGTAEVAAVFLDKVPAMAQRLSRAKARISAEGIAFALPEAEDLAPRLQSVLQVVYLIFTRGYALGPLGGKDLCEEALYLVRLLVQLAPDAPEVEGCHALLLLTHARRRARQSALGVSLTLAEQDRVLWEQAMIGEGLELLQRAMQRGQPGPFQIKAAIAACHAGAAQPGSQPDWPQIAALYAALTLHEPTPVVALNRAVALAEAEGPERGLAQMRALAPLLADYQPFHAAMAHYLSRSGALEEAAMSYRRAIDLAENPADAAFLAARLAALPPAGRARMAAGAQKTAGLAPGQFQQGGGQASAVSCRPTIHLGAHGPSGKA